MEQDREKVNRLLSLYSFQIERLRDLQKSRYDRPNPDPVKQDQDRLLGP